MVKEVLGLLLKFGSQVGLLEAAHSWPNAGVLLGVRMCR